MGCVRKVTEDGSQVSVNSLAWESNILEFETLADALTESMK